MTELEALRQVAEAARLYQEVIESPLCAFAEGTMAVRRGLLTAALSALDALPAPAAEGETVDIRAICLQAIADKLARVPKPRSYEMAHYCMGLEDAALAIQSKIVPLPRVPEVTGEVEG